MNCRTVSYGFVKSAGDNVLRILLSVNDTVHIRNCGNCARPPPQPLETPVDVSILH